VTRLTILLAIGATAIGLLASCIQEEIKPADVISPLPRGVQLISPLPEPTPASRNIFLPTIVR
jgi:hypothetical protein